MGSFIHRIGKRGVPGELSSLTIRDCPEIVEKYRPDCKKQALFGPWDGTWGVSVGQNPRVKLEAVLPDVPVAVRTTPTQDGWATGGLGRRVGYANLCNVTLSGVEG